MGGAADVSLEDYPYFHSAAPISCAAERSDRGRRRLSASGGAPPRTAPSGRSSSGGSLTSRTRWPPGQARPPRVEPRDLLATLDRRPYRDRPVRRHDPVRSSSCSSTTSRRSISPSGSTPRSTATPPPRWWSGGPFYEPRQLAGPYEVTPGDILYPAGRAVAVRPARPAPCGRRVSRCGGSSRPP